jgi:hypothetical protein
MTESQLQAQCVLWFNHSHRNIASLVHIPNHKLQRIELGSVAGWPDLMVVAGGRCLLIEMKTLDGVLSKSQREVHSRLAGQGTGVVVVRSFEKFQQVVSEWLRVVTSQN